MNHWLVLDPIPQTNGWNKNTYQIGVDKQSLSHASLSVYVTHIRHHQRSHQSCRFLGNSVTEFMTKVSSTSRAGTGLPASPSSPLGHQMTSRNSQLFRLLSHRNLIPQDSAGAKTGKPIGAHQPTNTRWVCSRVPKQDLPSYKTSLIAVRKERFFGVHTCLFTCTWSLYVTFPKDLTLPLALNCFDCCPAPGLLHVKGQAVDQSAHRLFIKEPG